MSNIDKYKLVELELPADLENNSKGEAKLKVWEDNNQPCERFKVKVRKGYDTISYGKKVVYYELTEIKSW